MHVELIHQGVCQKANLRRPLDISIPLREGPDTVNCFYAPLLDMTPVRMGSFVGDVGLGGPVNFYNVRLNPHGNGTHTECVGHISIEKITLNQCLTNFHFVAILHSVWPQVQTDGDRVITLEQLQDMPPLEGVEAVVLRTLPNYADKCRLHYSGTNPPYFHPEAVAWLVEKGVEHLLVDLPSVDREEDGGKLVAHRAFWRYPEATRTQATITELIFVNNFIADGLYLLNIQITSLELDASPSKPVLYALQPMT